MIKGLMVYRNVSESDMQYTYYNGICPGIWELYLMTNMFLKLTVT